MSDAFAEMEASAVAAGEEIDSALKAVATDTLRMVGLSITHPPTNTPRERLFDLAGEFFAVGRDADAHQIRTLATECTDTEVANFEDMAEGASAMWTEVLRAVQWMRHTLPVQDEKAAA